MEQNRGDRESPKSQLELHPLMPLASTASSTKAPGVGVDVLALAGRVSGVYHAPRICDRLFAFVPFSEKNRQERGRFGYLTGGSQQAIFVCRPFSKVSGGLRGIVLLTLPGRFLPGFCDPHLRCKSR